MQSPLALQESFTATNRLSTDRALDRLSPEPILSAIENFRGSFVDLERNLEVDAASLGRARSFLSRKLISGGLRSGDRIVVAISNGPLFACALDAVLRVGGSPLLVHFQLPAAELRRTALKYGAAFVLTDAEEPEKLTSIGADCTTYQSDWVRCTQISIDTTDLEFCGEFPSLPGVPLHPTSGSTSLPKIALRPGPCAIAEAVNYLGVTHVDQRDTLLVVTPMSHAYAYGMGLMVSLLSHAKIMSLRRFALKHVLEVLENSQVSIFPAVPAMIDMLLFGKGGNLLGRPRMVLSAGAPLARKTVENFARITGQLICPLYGTTETGGITVSPTGVTPDNFHSVGPPLAGVRAKISAADEADLGAGVGRVTIRSTSMMAGYLNSTGIDESLLSEGWFLTGDVGRITTTGEIELLGRESEVINVAGMKVVPSEVEEVLAQFPGVQECKVYAGTRKANVQFVKAAIVASPEFDLAQLREYCSQQLVYYKQPNVIARLDEMPRSPAGKIIKDQLP